MFRFALNNSWERPVTSETSIGILPFAVILSVVAFLRRPGPYILLVGIVLFQISLSFFFRSHQRRSQQ
jgi:hypothetical protein